nr:protein nrt1/ ptr family 5.10 [Quercus suber]
MSIETPLLLDTATNAVDYKGRRVLRSNSGGWRSACFMIGVEVAERFAYYGISCNLIMYLTEQLGQSTATAAENVNTWLGMASLLPLLGAFVADSYLGRYHTIIIASCIYILGLGLLTLSAMLTSISTSNNMGMNKVTLGSSVATLIISYVQENLSWGLGFGIPCVVMVIALGLFLLGTRTYRYSITEVKSPFVRIGRVFVTAIKNRRAKPSEIAIEEEACRTLPQHNFEQFKFLNKALQCKVCTVSEVEEAKAVLRLVPIWVTSLGYAIVFAQTSTFFTKQGATLDRTIFPGFEIPAASLQFFISLAIVLFIPVYDRIFVPIARAITTKPFGITMLQRIGIGMLLSVICMVVASLIEIKRLKTAKEYGLVDMPDVTIPMSVWWLLPQYVLSGIAEVFTVVGLQEFFYDQVPIELRSVGLALYLSIFGVGNFLSSFLVSIIEEVTGGDGKDSWFADNLNQAHLDYFYWLLAGLSAVVFAAYLYFAKSYIYNRPKYNLNSATLL